MSTMDIVFPNRYVFLMGVIVFMCRLRKSALACLNSGNKKVALRHARELKLANVSREKCATFLNRVVEVLDFITNAELTKKVILGVKRIFLN